MVDKFEQLIDELGLNEQLFQGFFGLEVEEHRITTDGRLSRYPYPGTFGSRRYHPYLQSDFTDSMLELITEPTRGGKEAVKNLKMLQQIVQSYLHQDERIWPLSMPPKLVADDLNFAKEDFTRPWFQGYRDYLEGKYGIEHEIVAGAHINYSVDEKVLKTLYENGPADGYESLAAFKNALYFKLAQNFVLNRWFFTYLFGASPISENNYQKLPRDLDYPVRSLRSSSLGYSNYNDEVVTYESLADQVSQLKQFVADGKFYSIHEFYGPVRIKGTSDNLDELLKQGINYLEFRSFDLDPLSRAGLSDDTLDLLEIFLAYSMAADLPTDMTTALRDADQRNEEIALGDPKDRPEWVRDLGGKLLNQLAIFAQRVNAPQKYTTAIAIAAKRVRNVDLTLGAQLAVRIEDDSLLSYGLKVANDRYLRVRSAQQPVQVLADRYSESIQKLVREAVVIGIRCQLLNYKVELTYEDHQETFDAQATLEFPKGVHEFVLQHFPEAIKLVNE